jgi:hypothetical protein
LEALSVIVIAPDLDPVAAGVNVTLIAQLAPAARVLGARGQLSVSAKSPLGVMALMDKAALPLLVRVIHVLPLVIVTGWWPKARDVGASATDGGGGRPAERLKTVPASLAPPKLVVP